MVFASLNHSQHYSSHFTDEGTEALRCKSHRANKEQSQDSDLGDLGGCAWDHLILLAQNKYSIHISDFFFIINIQRPKLRCEEFVPSLKSQILVKESTKSPYVLTTCSFFYICLENKTKQRYVGKVWWMFLALREAENKLWSYWREFWKPWRQACL